uniref:PHD-type domain-containing protein n=1 Tax=Peronospora matthiolae TaxID=2874970 RepID=A0AAV1UML8_9STRA
MAQSVTCYKCGCLNFSSRHNVCDNCRSKMMASSHNVLHLASESTGSSSASRIKSSAVPARSLGRKRRLDEILLAAKAGPGNYRLPVKSAFYKKQQQSPDVIDLISDDDEEELASDGHSNSKKQKKKTAITTVDDRVELASATLFQSRVFPVVTFVSSHFPSIEDGALLRKQATETLCAGSEPSGETVVAIEPPTSCQMPALRATLATPVSTLEELPEASSSPMAVVDPRPQPIVDSDPEPVAVVNSRPLSVAAGEFTLQSIPVVEPSPQPINAGKSQSIPVVELRPQPIHVVEPQPQSIPAVDPKPQPITVVDSKSSPVAIADPKPFPVAFEKRQQKAQQSTTTVETVLKQSDDLDVTKTNGTVKLETDVGTVCTQEKQNVQAERKLEDSLFRSRVFESIEFRATDFVTTAQVLATARRSHLPNLKSAASVIASVETTVLTEDGYRHADDLIGPVEEAKVASPTAASVAVGTSTTVACAAGSAKIMSSDSVVPPLVSSTTPVVTISLELSSASPSSGGSHPVANSTASLVPGAALPPAALKPAVKEPTREVAVPPVNSSSSRSHEGYTPSAAVQSVAPATKPLPSAAEVNMKPAISASSTSESTLAVECGAKVIPLVSATPRASVDVATKAAPASMTRSERTQATDNANVLLPQEKGPEDSRRFTGEQCDQQASLDGTNDIPGADDELCRKACAAPPQMAQVDPPVLGYCSPEFLEFMRECGNAGFDEEGDPNDVNRLQLKLLDVVDLTSLSSSENGDAISPSSTPRVGGLSGHNQRLCPSNNETVKKVGLSLADEAVNVSGQRTWYIPTLESERKRTQPEKVMCELCEEDGIASRLVRCPKCAKYYHKKCAEENGDESICWNCELGSMIDDSELDEEHAKHNSEYLAYLKAIRCSSDGADAEDEWVSEDEDQEGDEVMTEVKAGMAAVAESGEDSNAVIGMQVASAGRRWKEFIGDATADVDDSYLEITKRITEELRDNEKKCIYSRGFVSREEFEAQMHEVEEYYIMEEARLQQLERERALETKKMAEAAIEQAEAERTINGSQCAGNNAAGDDQAMASEISVQGCNVSTGDILPIAATASQISPSVAPGLSKDTAANHSTSVHLSVPVAAQTTVSAPLVPAATCAAASEVMGSGLPVVLGQPPSTPL